MKADADVRKRAQDMRRNLTRAETILWSRLKSRQLDGYQFRRQHPIGRYIADFACAKAKLVVEVDGATHASDREVAYDAARSNFIEQQGWTIFRALNAEIYENLNGVLDGIRLSLTHAKHH